MPRHHRRICLLTHNLRFFTYRAWSRWFHMMTCRLHESSAYRRSSSGTGHSCISLSSFVVSIHSGIMLPSRVGNSHCCLACLCDNEGSEVVDRLGHHLPYIRTALNITHQNILRNYFYYYNPYSITLSDIEREIINLRRHGYTNKIIAEKLNFSLGNVKYHLANVAGRVKLLNKNEKSVTGIASIIPLLVSSGLI